MPDTTLRAAARNAPLSPVHGLLRAAAPVALATLLGGCGGGGGGTSQHGPAAAPVVGATAFVESSSQPAAVVAAAKAASASTPASSNPPGSPLTAAEPLTAPQATESTSPLTPPLATTAVVGTPTPAPSAAPASNSPVVLESLVGQVNGRAVFASEIIEPLDDQLRARSAELAQQRRPRTEFRAEAEKLITGELMRVIRDELVLAEARASLTPEQRQGVFYFLNKIQEDLVSQQRGSAVAADEAARTSFGGSLRARAQDRLDQSLVGYEISQRIDPRVQVPWRSQQLQYEKDYEKYNPLPVAKYRLIQVLKQSSEDIEKIKSSLAAGTPFVDLALSDANLLSRADDATQLVRLTGKPDQELFAVPALTAAAQGLKVGDVVGPIESGRTVTWVMLESIEQDPPVSLYDAQLDIEFELRQKRRELEMGRYFERLSRRGNFSKIEDMRRRLLEIVEQRYPAPSPAASAPPAGAPPTAPARPAR